MTATLQIDDTPIDETSQPFVGRWNRLISTSNWEKGRIIQDWRDALIAADEPSTEYSDDAWSQRVGGVTGQHVGRLRRVYERFGETYEKYDGLYWSHFQAALDWDDAEMWLEGAIQNTWSVSRMRRQRWETLGSVPADEPQPQDIVVSEVDEDVDASIEQSPVDPIEDDSITASYAEVQGPTAEGPDFGDEMQPGVTGAVFGEDGAVIYSDDEDTIPFVRPFENLAELPDDLAEAFDAFKLAILRHKADDWQQISRDDTLASLDALKELVLAPAASDTPF